MRSSYTRYVDRLERQSVCSEESVDRWVSDIHDSIEVN